MKHVKLFEEFASGMAEGYSGNFPKDITLAKTKKVAEEVAKAMNMIAEPGEEYKVNTKTIDNASFDLDVVRNGMVDEYDGGSYNLYDDGSIVNMATWDRKTGESPVFGDWRKDNAKKIADNVKKMMNESLTEAAIRWQDAKEGDSALVKDLNKLGLIVKAYGRKFHLKFPDGSDKTYDASELEFITNEAVSEAESYRPGDKWSRDFDYNGMLQMGAEASIKTPIRDLEGLYKSMVDVNYHKEARHADAAIEALESGDKTTATKELKELNKLCKQALEESLHESKSEAELVKKANQFKKELMQLKKDPKGNELRIAAKEEQLSRVAQAIRNVRADKMGEAVTEAKDLRSLQKALDRLQNDYEAVLDDETLDAMSELIMTVNSKL